MKYILLIIACIFLMAACSNNNFYEEKSKVAKSIDIFTTIEIPIIQPFEKVIDKNCLYPVNNGTESGFINNKGEIISDFTYIETKSFKDGMGLVYTIDGLYGYVDISGNLVIDDMYYDAKDFSEGLAAVKNQYNLWGFINKKGEVVIDFLYQDAESFNNGIALVKKSDHNNACFINTKNQIIPTPEISYSDARYYNEGIIVYENKFYNILTAEYIELKSNNKEFKIYDNFSEGLGIITANNYNQDEFCYVNKNGEILNGVFDKAYPFKEGLAIVVEDNTTYCIDNKGKTIFERDGVYGTFNEGLVTFERNNKIGFINKKGDVVIPPIYDNCIQEFNDGIAVLELNYCLYYINTNNETVFQIGDSNAHISIP